MKNKILVIILVILVLVLSAELMVLFRKARTRANSSNPTSTSSPKSQESAHIEGSHPRQPTSPPPAPADIIKPVATPPPVQGPGVYACDPLGLCNNYSDENRKQYCQVTFADPHCLGACGDKTKWCTR